MFKKFVAGCGIGLMLMSTVSAHAENQEDKQQPMTQEEAGISDAIIGQLLDSLENARIDFEIVATDETDKGFTLDGLTLAGLLQFNSDWTVDIGEKKKSSGQLKKVMPVIKMDAKKLIASAQVMATSDTMYIDLDFFDKYDKKKKEWLRRPLTLSISNQFNKSLITIKFNWLKATITKSNDPNVPNQIKGSCYSEKQLLNWVTGKKETVPVNCEFYGHYSDKGHKIKFRYVNADSSMEIQP